MPLKQNNQTGTLKWMKYLALASNICFGYFVFIVIYLSLCLLFYSLLEQGWLFGSYWFKLLLFNYNASDIARRRAEYTAELNAWRKKHDDYYTIRKNTPLYTNFQNMLKEHQKRLGWVYRRDFELRLGKKDVYDLPFLLDLVDYLNRQHFPKKLIWDLEEYMKILATSRVQYRDAVDELERKLKELDALEKKNNEKNKQ